MDKKMIKEAVNRIFEQCSGNIISEKDAICPEVSGIKMFEAPLPGFGLATDELFTEYKKPHIIGPWFMTPSEWMTDAKTVISLFFPFTEEVKESNRHSTTEPSPAWLHGRIEGQKYITDYMCRLSEWFTQQGIHNCVPSGDSRFKQILIDHNNAECSTDLTYGSNWSERHAAYVCGLGTFGLSKGLITEKGIAGRFAGIIIDTEISPDIRKYSGVYDYCIQCGACIRRCPAHAISMEHGKDHIICNEQIRKITKLYSPRYGCGLCQTQVPCESRIPLKNASVTLHS